MEILAIVPILWFLMVAHELGHFIVARRSGITVEEFAIGFPPRILSIRHGGIRYSLGLVQLGAYVKMLGEEDPSAGGSFAAQSKRVRAAVLVAGSGMNFLVAVAAFALAYGTGWPQLVASPVEVDLVASGSPAETAGMAPGDVIHAIEGQPIGDLTDFQLHIRARLGQRTQLSIERSGASRTIEITPRTEFPQGQGPLGIRIKGHIAPIPHGPLESIVFGFRRTLEAVTLTLVAPVLAFRGELATELIRPIGLPGMTQVAASAASAVIGSGWWFPILVTTGAFSAGLAVMNMLPIPALDGGRLLFVGIEALRGRRVPPEREALIHFMGMAFLLSLMIVIFLYDVVVPPPAIDWGVR